MNHVVSSIEPSPQTTLVILLGASKWPLSSLTNSLAFTMSANKVRKYFCNIHQFGLPPENWLDLFDRNQSNPNEVDQAIGDFLDRRIRLLEQAGTPAKDLLFYYIGHGIFAFDSEQAYHLAILSTRDENIGVSAVAMASLAYTLKTKARYLRRIVILDCCFAATSFRYMQSAPDQVAIEQTKSAFEEKSEGSGFPKRGTALLCSSGHKNPSLILQDESGTMFSEALVRALSLGKTDQPDKTHLSLHDLKQLTIDILEMLAGKNAPKPEVHSPDQSDGDVASVPFFPNLHAIKKQICQTKAEKHHLAEERISLLPSQTLPPIISPHTTIPSQNPILISPSIPLLVTIPQDTPYREETSKSSLASILLEWIGIPEGHIIVKKVRTHKVESFSISKYPITYMQFQAFIDDNGYSDDRWWEGLATRFYQPGKANWLINDYPRETVSWYEAIAFCRWLSNKLGQKVTLPTEIQWQRAAQGDDDREYSWGNKFDKTRCNTSENGTRQTTSIYAYPSGASSYGVMDMCGNVKEWCLNEYTNSAEINLVNDAPRALRGGSWNNDHLSARVSERDFSFPNYRLNNIGFRIVIGDQHKKS